MPRGDPVRAARIWLGLALVVHALLAGTYAVRAPAWEGPDENDHAYYASFLQATGRQPTILKSSATTGRAPWEEGSLGHHPPLYYALLVAVAAITGHGDCTPYWSPPPDRVPGAALQWQHGHDERAPVSAEISVLRWQRLLSTALGAVSIALAFALARELFPSRPGTAAWAALSLACLPQWSWMHGVLDNGNLAAALAAATSYVLVRGVRRRRLHVGAGVLLGLLLGTALLTKLTALFLLPLVVLAFTGAAVAWPGGRGRTLLGFAVAMVLAAAISGAWFWRNAQLYGDPLALVPHAVAYASNRLPADMRTSYLGGDFVWRTLHTTFAAVGWSLRPAPPAAEVAALIALGLGAVGWLWRLRTLAREGGAALSLALVSLVLTAAGYVQFNLSFIQPQGRYLFPAAGVGAVLVAAGLSALPWPRRPLWPTLAGAIVIAGAFALQHVHFLPALRTGDAPHRCYASSHEGLHTVGAPDRRTLEALTPEPGAALEGAPTFRWHDPLGSAATVYSVHIWFPDGLVFATWETAQLELTGDAWTIPDGYWATLPRGRTLRWRVRRVADRARGEAAREQPESELRELVRR
ncbi:MAG: glycosyltransferase family 39 protein [Planctomycetota bacterium]